MTFEQYTWFKNDKFYPKQLLIWKDTEKSKESKKAKSDKFGDLNQIVNWGPPQKKHEHWIKEELIFLNC